MGKILKKIFTLFLIISLSYFLTTTEKIGHASNAVFSSKLSHQEKKIVLAQQTLPQGLEINYLATNTTNLLHDSSFEQEGDGKPQNWNYQLDSSAGNTFISREGNRSGAFGLKFTGGGTGNFGISQPDVKTIPGRTYTLSLYIKYINAPKITIRLGFWNEYHNKEGQMKSYSFSGTQDWTRISITTITPGVITDPNNEFPMIEIEG